MKMPKDFNDAKRTLAETKPDLKVGDTVEVDAGIDASWIGWVGAVKPSLTSGWWVDVKHSKGMTWTVPASAVCRTDPARKA